MIDRNDHKIKHLEVVINNFYDDLIDLNLDDTLLDDIAYALQDLYFFIKDDIHDISRKLRVIEK